MNNQKLLKSIEEVLKTDERLWFLDEKTKKQEFDIRTCIGKLEHYDEEIIHALFQNQTIKEKFFIKTGNSWIFKCNHFQFFLEEHKVDNSYTEFKNRIGLSDSRRFLKDNKEMVLNFPFKDCILEGGQSTEEGKDTYFKKDKQNKYQKTKAKRKEIFYNEILAHDEIDRLLDEKAFVNFKKYSKNGKEKIQEIKRDENNLIKENLIIKGNNLIALHSLKKQFAKKIKLIYIDPPYNTGNDGFKYNDNFNHSTWLTFMKNRLEIARELLREDGVMFVQCDDNEQAYLKVLMDEVFGRGNFIQTITVKMSETSGVKMAHKDKKVAKIKEHLIIFSNHFKIENYPITFDVDENKILKQYSRIIENPKDDYTKWTFRTLKKEEKNNTKFIFENKDYIFRTAVNKSLKIKKTNYIIKQDNKFYLNGEDILWLKDKFKQDKLFEYLGDIWMDIKTTGIANEGQVKLKNGKKPEALLQRIIEIATKEQDIVLDFFAGSGTTGAVAHKMNRQYILIEQMGYIHDLPESRLKKVIAGEQGGISKAVKWQGGGSFIYCELAQWNEKAKEQILHCENLEALKKFFQEMVEKYFLNYNLKIKEFQEKVLEEEDFKNLPLEKQKEMFCKMLDNNMIYVCRSEMEDAKFEISENDIEMTNKFYGKEN